MRKPSPAIRLAVLDKATPATPMEGMSSQLPKMFSRFMTTDTAMDSFINAWAFKIAEKVTNSACTKKDTAIIRNYRMQSDSASPGTRIAVNSGRAARINSTLKRKLALPFKNRDRE